MAFGPEGMNWKWMSHSLGALWPFTSGEVNCQRRAAFKAGSAKYGLGAGESSVASATFPGGTKRTRALTRTTPGSVGRALSGASGTICSTTLTRWADDGEA